MSNIASFLAAAALLALPAAAFADTTTTVQPAQAVWMVEGPLVVLDARGTVVGQLVPNGPNNFQFQPDTHREAVTPQTASAFPKTCPPKGYTLDIASAIEFSTSQDLITPLSECAP
jgi:hypothetical protein